MCPPSGVDSTGPSIGIVAAGTGSLVRGLALCDLRMRDSPETMRGLRRWPDGMRRERFEAPGGVSPVASGVTTDESLVGGVVKRPIFAAARMLGNERWEGLERDWVNESSSDVAGDGAKGSKRRRCALSGVCTDARPARVRAMERYAVSYTHLTLPTNREV